MTNRDCAFLGFRLVGLWLMVTAVIAVANIPSFWDPMFAQVRTMSVVATLLPALVSLGIGASLWASAGWLAAGMFPDPSDESTRLDRVRGEAVFALALSIIGVLFVAEAIPVLVNGLALFVQSRTASRSVLGPTLEEQQLVWSAAAKANVVAGIVRLLIGVALLAGPKKLGAALGRARKELTGSLEDEASAEEPRSPLP